MKSLLLVVWAVGASAAAQTVEPSPASVPASVAPATSGLGVSPDESGARNPFPSEGPQFDTFRDVANDLRCPTCTGLSILDSEAAFSVQIRDLVKEQVAAGKGKREILDFFTERYGPWILRAPPTKGFNALAWALPLGLLILGPPLIWFFVWRKRKFVSTMGVRSNTDILTEMNAELARLRQKMGTK